MSLLEPVRFAPQPDSCGDTQRADPITPDRYTSVDFMRREQELLWPRVWNIGAWRKELIEPGDYVTHALGRESILMVLQNDGGVRAFFNVCRHRGNRLIDTESGGVDQFTCAYHGWKYGLDGRLNWVQDEDDFPRGGNPCGRLNLVELKCETFAGFVWYNMSPQAPSLKAYLGDLYDLYASYHIEDMTRTRYQRCEVPFNWKVLHDNFCESYHLPATHPQLSEYFEDDYRETIFEIFPSGHSNMRMKGATPSKRDVASNHIYPQLASLMRKWDLDPADFIGRGRDVRTALQRQIRQLAPQRGYTWTADLDDDQLTDAFHTNLFPSTSITMNYAGGGLQRSEPHPTDPARCIYERWTFTHADPAGGLVGRRGEEDVANEEATLERIVYGEKSIDQTVDQDLAAGCRQQLGFYSRGFDEAYLTGQENRIHQFHDTINDYLEKRR